MNDIKVTVLKPAQRKYYMLRFIDPVSGKQYHRSTKTTRKNEALKAAGEWEQELRSEGYYHPSTMLWSEFVDLYFEEHLTGLSEAYGKSFLTAKNHLERVISPRKLASIDDRVISKFVMLLRQGGMKATTINSHLGALAAAFSWAEKQGYMRKAPRIEKPKRAKGVGQFMRGRPLKEHELDQMLAAVPEVRKEVGDADRWQYLLRGLWWSGLRISEAITLSWEPSAGISVDLEGEFPRLRIFAESEKGHKDRLLPLAPEFSEMLQAVPEEDRFGLVFDLYGKDGKSPLSSKHAIRVVSKIGKKANIITRPSENRTATAHDFRRTFGTRWAKLVKPITLMKLMRHESIAMTMKFYVDQDVDEIGRMLSEAISENYAEKQDADAVSPNR